MCDLCVREFVGLSVGLSGEGGAGCSRHRASACTLNAVGLLVLPARVRVCGSSPSWLPAAMRSLSKAHPANRDERGLTPRGLTPRFSAILRHSWWTVFCGVLMYISPYPRGAAARPTTLSPYERILRLTHKRNLSLVGLCFAFPSINQSLSQQTGSTQVRTGAC